MVFASYANAALLATNATLTSVTGTTSGLGSLCGKQATECRRVAPNFRHSCSLLRVSEQILSVNDLTMVEAHSALLRLRLSKVKASEVVEHDPSTYHMILQYTGGRLALLNKVARAHDMHAAAEDLLTVEKAWLQSRIGLIPDCDDDVCPNTV